MSHPYNKTLAKALQSISHPLTIGAVVVLLINDHLLRWVWPSWWTGKLGDAAWLTFFSLILTMPLALALPEQWKRKEVITIGVALGLTAVVYALMNTFHALRDIGGWLFERTTGRPFLFWTDPTDLMVLPCLAISWWIWQESGKSHKQNASQGWAFLILGALATVANTPAPPSGINCIYLGEDGSILVSSTYGGYVYVTQDGGLNWKQISERMWDADDECSQSETRQDWVVMDPNNSRVRYRLVQGVGIYRSVDGGNTWSFEKDLSLTEAQIAYYENVEGLFYFEPGPLDAIIDAQTGNLIIAMGEEGILTRTSSGEWIWADGVSYYERAVMSAPNRVFSLLTIEFILGLALAFLAINVMSYVVIEPKVFKLILTILGWLGWFYIALLPPALTFATFGYGLVMAYLFPLILLIIVIDGVIGVRHIRKSLGMLPREAWLPSILLPLIFILPFIIWSQGIIPRYSLAQGLALLLITATLFASGRALSHMKDQLRSGRL